MGERFHEQFPYYLAMGMTEAQYWDSDPMLARAYRKAEKIRNAKINERAWLQGLYIYEALCDAAPIFHDFAKRGTKAHPYSDRPYSLDKQDEKKEENTKDKQTYTKGMERMQALMRAMDKKFNSEKEVNPNG